VDGQDTYHVWRLRFEAFITDKRPSLIPALLPDSTDEALEPVVRRQFAAALVPWLSEEVISSYRSGIDMRTSGIAVLRKLESHFVESRQPEMSPQEIFESAMRVRRTRPQFKDNLAAFLAEVQKPLLSLPKTTARGERNVFAEHILALHILQELNHASWLSHISAEFRESLRSGTAGDFDLQKFCSKILLSVPPQSDRDRYHDARASADTRDHHNGRSSGSYGGSKAAPSKSAVAVNSLQAFADTIPSGHIGFWAGDDD
jgi:hypothetical protein